MERTRGQVDFSRRPVEDFARATIRLATAEGQEVMIEATTSWAYVGAGLRIQLELLGPEYAMDFSSLSTGLKIFIRTAERRAGKECVSTCRSRWPPYH